SDSSGDTSSDSSDTSSDSSDTSSDSSDTSSDSSDTSSDSSDTSSDSSDTSGSDAGSDSSVETVREVAAEMTRASIETAVLMRPTPAVFIPVRPVVRFRDGDGGDPTGD